MRRRALVYFIRAFYRRGAPGLRPAQKRDAFRGRTRGRKQITDYGDRPPREVALADHRDCPTSLRMHLRFRKRWRSGKGLLPEGKLPATYGHPLEISPRRPKLLFGRERYWPPPIYLPNLYKQGFCVYRGRCFFKRGCAFGP